MGSCGLPAAVALTPAARMLHQQRGCSNSSEDAPRAVRMLHQHHLRMQLRSHVVLAVFGVALPPRSSFIGLKVIQTLSQGQSQLLASHPGCQIPPKRGRERASSLLEVSISDGPEPWGQLCLASPHPKAILQLADVLGFCPHAWGDLVSPHEESHPPGNEMR